MAFRVSDAMTTAVISISQDALIDEVFELLLRHHVSGLPVVDDDKNLVGVVSELDLLVLLDSQASESSPVSEYLSGDVLTVHEDDLLTDVTELFLKHNYRRLPVVRDGKLVGVISRRDLVRYIRDIRSRVQAEMSARRDIKTSRNSSAERSSVGV
ncbi:MAG: CBS domain-containing protein [Thermoguttaceae bacterium]